MKVISILLLGLLLTGCGPAMVGDTLGAANANRWTVVWQGQTYTNCVVSADSIWIRFSRVDVDDTYLRWQSVDTITFTKE